MASIKPGKAPSPDGLTGKMVRLAYAAAPDAFLEMFNHCLSIGRFPLGWKEAGLVLIPKPLKPLKPGQAQQSYRPIYLLSVIGKVLERLINVRLNDHLGCRISSSQYGFMSGRSATDAISAEGKRSMTEDPNSISVLIAFDIRNAFNTATWNEIVK